MSKTEVEYAILALCRVDIVNKGLKKKKKKQCMHFSQLFLQLQILRKTNGHTVSKAAHVAIWTS